LKNGGRTLFVNPATQQMWQAEGTPSLLFNTWIPAAGLFEASQSRIDVTPPRGHFVVGRLLMIDWLHSGPSVAAAFIGSSVEAIEALTVVLAVGTVRGWRSALLGTTVGLALLVAVVVTFGPAIALAPIDQLRIVVGTLLVLFGLRWLRKAILRSAGVVALHDEDAAFIKETQVLRLEAASRQRWDLVAIITAFKAVVLEGIEVVVIVIGVGAVGNMLIPASIGALAACLLVVCVGLMLHRPLSRVPENTLKFAVGILISAFGLFWFGEGIGITWLYQDAAIAGLAAALLVVSWAAVGLARYAGQIDRQTIS
jgi:Ca2+/H+ antiporter, TMEM165/GDT1 family